MPIDERLRTAIAAAEVLAAVGKLFVPGELVITGSLVQVRVAAGDTVEREIEGLGAIRLRIG